MTMALRCTSPRAFILLTFVASTAGTLHVSWDAKKTLLSLDDEIKITKIIGTPTPIYRKDLPKNYVAYWEVKISDTNYAIVSGGPKTADYRIVMEGRQPSCTDEMHQRATLHGRRCDKFYMVLPSPNLRLICENEYGDVIAATGDEDIDPSNEVHTSSNYTDRHSVITKNTQSLMKQWMTRAKEVKQDEVWSDEENVSLQELQNDRHGRDNASRLVNEYNFVISLGQTDKIPVDDPSKVTINVHGSDTSGDKLCEIIGICSGDKLDATKLLYTPYGQGYVNIVPTFNRAWSESKHLPGVAFKIHIKGGNQGEDVTKHYYLDFNRRTKRGSWSSWTHYSIGDGNLFPHYKQHKHSGKGCSVGCGPVAWAMIFSYFDRRSHQKPSVYGTGSQGLFRCGSSGTSGGNQCVAPRYTSSTINKYTESLHSILKTFCISGSGATWPRNMDRVKSFFTHRQTRGSPRIKLDKKTIIGVPAYGDKIRNRMIDHLKNGWPSIVGVNVDGIFSAHYPVATQYKQRSRRVRKCKKILFWKRCKWRTEWTRSMYVHMGWGGSSDGWRPAKTWLAAAAMY